MAQVKPRADGFGAEITGVDLARPLPAAERDAVWNAFEVHGVVWFPDQEMSVEDLERLTLDLGEFGEDPFIRPMDGHAHVLEVRREASETGPNFGAAWHSDWSFQETPPSATLLYAEIVPPAGGDTLFADGCAAWDSLGAAEQARLLPLRAVHSARRAYGPSGAYARGLPKGAMKIEVSDEADAAVVHPLVRTNPRTGRRCLFANPVYTVGIEGADEDESAAILAPLFALMTEDRFVYRHRWSRRMLTMWDNRRLNHFADGGYDGHARLMRRTTLAGERPA